MVSCEELMAGIEKKAKLDDDKNSPDYESNYVKTLADNIVGKNLKYDSQYGVKSLIYADYTASGRGLEIVENFISKQVLPFYANVHSNAGYLAEQSEDFRAEAKTIVRRYFNTDERDSIIFSGHGTTSCVNKLIKLMNLKEHVDFYNKVKILKSCYDKFKEVVKTEDSFLTFVSVNSELVDDIKQKYFQLFEIANFCYLNRWGSFDCTLCRMTFLMESQYNQHEKSETHRNNINQCAQTEDSIFKSFTNKFDIAALIGSYERLEPVVFLSILEHNSNALPWRETGAKIVYIDYEDEINYVQLEDKLREHKDKVIKMGSFTGASNITGIYQDADYISLIMHKHKALVFFDYATAGPYIKADMNQQLSPELRKLMGFTRTFTHEEEALIYKDALFLSPHKFLGGPNTPGLLIVKQHVVRNLLIPSEPGGGVVLFVRKERQNYVKNIESREESGTPDIIGSVRIGLALMLREKISHEFILTREEHINDRVLSRLRKIPNLFLLGSQESKRIPIYSFVIKFGKKLLHYNFVSSLLNDMFGIQSRGGCSCASTYGQYSLGLKEDYTENLETLVCSGSEIFRPGYTRLNFPYFYEDYIIDYMVTAIEYVAKHGWMFLSHYAFKIESGRYYHRNDESEKRRWLNQIDFSNGKIIIPELLKESSENLNEDTLDGLLDKANEILANIKNVTKHIVGKSKINNKILFANNESERWFLVSDDIEELFYTNEILQENIDKFIGDELNIKFEIESKLRKAQNKLDEVITQDNCNKEISTKEIADSILSDNKLEGEENQLSMDFTFSEKSNKAFIDRNLFPEMPKKIIRLIGEASKDFNMLRDGDRILVAMSGGKDSMSLLHALVYFQKKVPFKFEVGGVTVDPQSSDYNPRPMIDYMNKLGIKYFYESDPILERAKNSLQNDSICAFCARMKRGIIYNCARREGYNVIAMGQHLDDLAESFLMSSFHNGMLRTMKANYVIDQGDLRVIRPLVYCREKLFKEFTLKHNIPVIQENCPACFSAPKERHRVKVLLAQQENMYPNLFSSLQKAMKPLMTGILESGDTKKDDIEL